MYVCMTADFIAVVQTHLNQQSVPKHGAWDLDHRKLWPLLVVWEHFKHAEPESIHLARGRSEEQRQRRAWVALCASQVHVNTDK